jgi:hypothetical protein
MDLHRAEPEIPYEKFERSLRSLVCSLMERQDRMNEEIFLQINDFQYRMDDVEALVSGAFQKKESTEAEG